MGHETWLPSGGKMGMEGVDCTGLKGAKSIPVRIFLIRSLEHWNGRYPPCGITQQTLYI